MPSRDDEITARLFRDAGIGEGMRVLDVGCGYGKVTRLVAECVGPRGHVLGIDINEVALERARVQAERAGLGNVAFEHADLSSPPGGTPPYDAVVGRRVLMYVPDRVAALRALTRVLRPGGVVAFHEVDGSTSPQWPTHYPLHETADAWLWDTVAREGGSKTMGFDLPTALENAGLHLRGIRGEAVIEHATMRQPNAERVRAVLPRILAQGVATEAEVDIDTLDTRLHHELQTRGGVRLATMTFCAWATRRE